MIKKSNTFFEHFIMTRFNLATPGRESVIRTQEGWLEYRFKLFERYCIPSIAQQSSSAFKWIIYFDKDTPDQYKDHIKKLQKEVAFKAYYTELFRTEGWRNSLFEAFCPKAGNILTTRLDSDDVISVDFVQRLHEAIEDNNYATGVYNFRKGLIRQGEALFRINHESNAFFSLLEPNGPDVFTAPSIKHMEIRRQRSLFQIDNEPSWMQIIHDSNVSNKVRGWRTDYSGLASRFPDEAMTGLKQPSNATLFVDNIILAPMRLTRDIAINVLRYGRTKA